LDALADEYCRNDIGDEEDEIESAHDKETSCGAREEEGDGQQGVEGAEAGQEEEEEGCGWYCLR